MVRNKMSRWLKVSLYLFITVFLSTSLWLRGASYSYAITYNSYQNKVACRTIAQESYQELPQVPFIFYPTFYNFTFATADELFGLYFEEFFANRTFEFQWKQKLVLKPLSVCLHSSPPIFIRVQSLRY